MTCQRWTRESLIDVMRSTCCRYPASYTKAKGRPTPGHYIKEFGSWAEAIRVADAPAVPKIRYVKKLKPYTRQELITILLNAQDYRKDYFNDKNNKLPSSYYYIKEFGSWTLALDAAGLPTNTLPSAAMRTVRNPSKSTEELIKILQDSPNKTYDYFQSPHTDTPCASTYVKRFGSWSNALSTACLPPNGNCLLPCKDTTVYLIEFDGFYKVGITQRTIQQRFAGFPNYEVILTLNCSLPEARILEKQWLATVSEFKFTPTTFPAKGHGESECFIF